MADVTFYTNPMSRGRIVRWMLEETGCDYDTVVVDFDAPRPAELAAITPLGKVPALVHGDVTVTETAAICAYLADAFPDAGLAPRPADRGAYYRWLFYAAGPIEAAVTDRSLGVVVTPDKAAFVGYGDYDRMVAALAAGLDGRRHIAGDAFSAADVYLGAQIGSGLAFGTLPAHSVLVAYHQALTERPAYKRATAMDDALLGDAAG